MAWGRRLAPIPSTEGPFAPAAQTLEEPDAATAHVDDLAPIASCEDASLATVIGDHMLDVVHENVPNQGLQLNGNPPTLSACVRGFSVRAVIS
eukprot:1738569-Pyramimonas_sp.AAC.1